MDPFRSGLFSFCFSSSGFKYNKPAENTNSYFSDPAEWVYFKIAEYLSSPSILTLPLSFNVDNKILHIAPEQCFYYFFKNWH